MSKTNIRINALSLMSIEKALADIEALKKKIKRLEEELPKQLAEFGKDYAQAEFNDALYDVLWDGEPLSASIVVSTDPTEHGFIVRADGAEVCYVEFGAGVFFESAGLVYEGERPPGIDGIGQHGELGKQELWTFQDGNGQTQVTYGTPPNNVMYHMGEEIRRRVEETARRILNDD